MIRRKHFSSSGLSYSLLTQKNRYGKLTPDQGLVNKDLTVVACPARSATSLVRHCLDLTVCLMASEQVQALNEAHFDTEEMVVVWPAAVVGNSVEPEIEEA